jgi:hypothetical protein
MTLILTYCGCWALVPVMNFLTSTVRLSQQFMDTSATENSKNEYANLVRSVKPSPLILLFHRSEYL